MYRPGSFCWIGLATRYWFKFRLASSQSRQPAPLAADRADDLHRARSDDDLVNRQAGDKDAADEQEDDILLRFFEGLAPREIAANLGVPAETARSRVQRGVAVLRAQLDD